MASGVTSVFQGVNEMKKLALLGVLLMSTGCTLADAANLGLYGVGLTQFVEWLKVVVAAL